MNTSSVSSLNQSSLDQSVAVSLQSKDLKNLYQATLFQNKINKKFVKNANLEQAIGKQFLKALIFNFPIVEVKNQLQSMPMKMTGSLLYSIARILFKKSYYLNTDMNDLIMILKRGFKNRVRRPAKKINRQEMDLDQQMEKASKDSLENPRNIANPREVTLQDNNMPFGSDGLLSPDKILDEISKKSKETDSRGKLNIFTDSKQRDQNNMEMDFYDDDLPQEYLDNMNGGFGDTNMD